MLLSVAKWSRLFEGNTETKSAPKRIFSANGNGLRNVFFLTTQEQKNVHIRYATQVGVRVYGVNRGLVTKENNGSLVGSYC